MSRTIMTWRRLFYNPTMVVIINRQAGWIPIEYLKTNIFVKSEHWRPTQIGFFIYNIYKQIDYEDGLLTRIFFKEEMTRT